MLLFLNDVSGSEILLILVFILIFFGSKSIPGIARTMGRTIRQIKDASNDMQNEIRKSTGDFKKDLNLKSLIQDAGDELKRPMDQMAHDLDDAVKYSPPRPTTKFPGAHNPEVAPQNDGLLKESLLVPDPAAPAETSSETKNTSKPDNPGV